MLNFVIWLFVFILASLCFAAVRYDQRNKKDAETNHTKHH